MSQSVSVCFCLTLINEISLNSFLPYANAFLCFVAHFVLKCSKFGIRVVVFVCNVCFGKSWHLAITTLIEFGVLLDVADVLIDAALVLGGEATLKILYMKLVEVRNYFLCLNKHFSQCELI